MSCFPRRILHVLNYGWPYIDGYTVRSSGLIEAQRRTLCIEATVAVSPFPAFAKAKDPAFQHRDWGPAVQLEARRHGSTGPRAWERPILGLAPVSSAEFTGELISLAKRTGAEVIHAHHPHYIGMAASEAARALGLPFVYEIRCFNGDYLLNYRNPYARLHGYWTNRRERAVIRRADAVVTIADGLARRIARFDREALVVRNSVNARLFHPNGSTERTEPQATVVAGYATTFEDIENLDGLVLAAEKAARELARDGRKLVVRIAGQGRRWEQIRDLVNARGLEQVVELPGSIPYGQMPDFLRGLDVFVVPRKPAPVTKDTTPLKPLEALAVGRPLLCTDLPALRELLGDHPGVRFTQVDPENLAQGLIRFAREPWSSDVGLPERTWDKEVLKYRDVYAQAAANAEKRAAQPQPSRPPGTWRRRAVRVAAERQWFGLTPFQRHVVICGLPRSGSTLLQLMIQATVENVRTLPEECPALAAAQALAPTQPFFCTKRPADIHEADAIREYYAKQPGEAFFVFTVRDPRDVLTSRHAAYAADRGYYVEPERFRQVAQDLLRLADGPDTLIVRYEDLVANPDAVQQRLEAAIGWRSSGRFAECVQALEKTPRSALTEGALGGLRSPETSRIGRWQAPEHAERLAAVEAALPELGEFRARFGYASENQPQTVG